MTFRVIVSALVVGAISIGNSIQSALSSGGPASRWQVYSALIGGIILMLNDIKSRLTPPETADVSVPTKTIVIP